jgi:2-keto-3-deoxy-L-rhamnonate aldolase RhmA
MEISKIAGKDPKDARIQETHRRRSKGPEYYFYRANDNILVILILETKEALENLEAIASVPGVDALYVGAFDLFISLGLDPMRQPHAEIEAALSIDGAPSSRRGCQRFTSSSNSD